MPGHGVLTTLKQVFIIYTTDLGKCELIQGCIITAMALLRKAFLKSVFCLGNKGVIKLSSSGALNTGRIPVTRALSVIKRTIKAGAFSGMRRHSGRCVLVKWFLESPKTIVIIYELLSIRNY